MENKGVSKQLSTKEGAFTAEFTWPVTLAIDKGLDGAVTNKSKVGYVDGDKGRLIYQGYPVEILAENTDYEEVSYLLLFGKLPNEKEYAEFNKNLKANRNMPVEVVKIMDIIYDHEHSHPMSLLRTAVSVLGVLQKNVMDTTRTNELRMGMQLIASLPTIIAALHRLRLGLKPIEPDMNLNHVENFLYMLHGKKQAVLDIKLLEISMILHADHGMNASTLTAVATSASLSDLYSSIVGAIGSLKGPLHGGANEVVLKEFLKIKNVNHVKEFVAEKAAKKEKIMGFGHRIYKTYDPRAAVLKKYASKLSGEVEMFKIAEVLDKEVVAKYGSKGIYPNVDFYSGIIYKHLGFETNFFTTIFAAARISGWLARILEYRAENRIFRPRDVYVGEFNKEFIEREKRS
jgi:citrate synthase